MRRTSLDDILIVLMSLVAFTSVAVLYGEKLMPVDSGDEAKVASIVEQLKTVKRKRDFYQGWADVKPGDSLAPNDEIYTHAQSSAKINFVNGPQISLFENSLLRIKKEGSATASLSLEKGNLHARLDKNTPKLDLEIGKKKYSFESTQANIQIEQGATENKFMVLEGNANFGEGKAKKTIQADQVLIENKETGKVTISEIPFIPLIPKQDTIYFYDQKKSVNFKWKTQQPNSSSQFVLARDLAFQTIVANKAVNEIEHTLELTEPGIYYWKIESPEGTSGPIRSFSLIQEIRPTVNLDKKTLYQSVEKPGKILISWPPEKNLKPAVSYMLRINSPERPLKELKISGHSYEWTPETFGLHSVGLRIADSTRPQALWSEPIDVSVIEEKAVEIRSISPDYIEKINYAQGPTAMGLNWDGPTSDFSYTVTLIHAQKKAVTKTLSPALLLELKNPGTYQWSVQGESLSGIKTNTLKGTILVKNPVNINITPAQGAVIELERPDQLINFKWKNLGNATYDFELSKNAAFDEIVHHAEVKSDNLSTTVGEVGKYFWRVKIKGKGPIEYSVPVSVELRPSPPLKSPDTVPDLKLKLRYQEAPPRSSFNLFNLFIATAVASDPIAVTEWDLPPNTRAKEYVVEIYADKERINLVTRLRTNAPHVMWKNALPGTFFWQVAYVDYWGRQTEFSKLSLLNTEIDVESQKEAFTTIDLYSPKHRQRILSQKTDEFEFNWNTNNKSKFQLLISKDLDFDEIVLKKETSNNSVTLTCKQLPQAGEYYWKILSGKFSSKRRQFSSQCTDPAPEKEQPHQPEIPIIAIEEPVYVPASRELKLTLFPHKMTYENKANDYSAKVDGLAMNSFMASYRGPWEMKWFKNFEARASISRGKVFNTITYNDYEVALKLLRKNVFFEWGPLIGFMKKTLYVEAGRTIADSASQNPYLGLAMQKHSQHFYLSAEIKGAAMIAFNGNAQYKFKKHYSAGPFFEITTIDKENAKHSFSQIGLQLSYSFGRNENE